MVSFFSLVPHKINDFLFLGDYSAAISPLVHQLGIRYIVNASGFENKFEQHGVKYINSKDAKIRFFVVVFSKKRCLDSVLLLSRSMSDVLFFTTILLMLFLFCSQFVGFSFERH
jgi:hypothetical protein